MKGNCDFRHLNENNEVLTLLNIGGRFIEQP